MRMLVLVRGLVRVRMLVRGQLVGGHNLVLPVRVDAVLHVLHPGHDLVAHVEPELAQLARLDQRAVLVLLLPHP